MSSLGFLIIIANKKALKKTLISNLIYHVNLNLLGLSVLIYLNFFKEYIHSLKEKNKFIKVQLDFDRFD